MKKISSLISIMAMAALLGFPFHAIAAEQTNEATPLDRENQEVLGSDRDADVNQNMNADVDKAKSDRTAAEERVNSAIRLFKEGVAISNTIPASVIEKAAGIAVIPEWTKAALVAGGSYGSGVLMSKQDNGEWSNPLFISLTGGSVGAQVGYKSSDLILVFTNHGVLEQLAKDEDFTLGVDASVAAGDVDKSKSASLKDAQVLTYKRTSGLFAGASLDGTVLQIQKDPTLAYYSLPQGNEDARGYFGKDDAPLYEQIIGSDGKDAELDRAVIPDSTKRLKDAVKEFVSSIKDRSKD